MLDVLADILGDLAIEGIAALTRRAIGSAISGREEELLDHSTPERSTTLRQRRRNRRTRHKRDAIAGNSR
jgi:hypothetical protein